MPHPGEEISPPAAGFLTPQLTREGFLYWICLAAVLLLLVLLGVIGLNLGGMAWESRWFRRLSLLGVVLITGLLVASWFLLTGQVRERRQAEKQLLEYQEQLQYLASQLSLAEERERRRLAVFLHDHIGQKLAIASIKLGQVQACLEQGNGPALAAQLEELRQLLKETIQETKSVTFQISSPILHELGLEAALEWQTEEIQQKHGLITYFEDDQLEKPLTPDLKILLFQAATELMLNVVKHAHARQLQVSVWREGDQLRLGVYDDGIGFAPQQLDWHQGRKTGFGLFSIRGTAPPLRGAIGGAIQAGAWHPGNHDGASGGGGK